MTYNVSSGTLNLAQSIYFGGGNNFNYSNNFNNDNFNKLLLVLFRTEAYTNDTYLIEFYFSHTVHQFTKTSSLFHSVCNFPRSTQPCIPPGSLNRVPALAGVKAGKSPRQVTLCDLIWHVISRSGVVISITNCYIRFTLLYFMNAI